MFGQVHQRETVAAILGIRPEDISDEGAIQTVSTGLAFVIVPLRSLRTLQSLSPDFKKADAYIGGFTEVDNFFYITRDTEDASIDLRARGLWATGEDPATGSAAGCVAAWTVRNGVAKSGKIVISSRAWRSSAPARSSSARKSKATGLSTFASAAMPLKSWKGNTRFRGRTAEDAPRLRMACRVPCSKDRCVRFGSNSAVRP